MDGQRQSDRTACAASGIRLTVRTTRCPAAIFSGTKKRNEYRCPQGRALRSDWRPFKNPRTHITKADTIIYRVEAIRLRELPDEGTLLPQHADSQDPLAAFMNLHAMLLVPSPKPVFTSNRAKIERKWRCCLRTSSGS